MSEDGPVKKVTVSLTDPETIAILKAHRKRLGVSNAGVVKMALRGEL